MATDITNVNQIKAAPVLTAGKMVKAGTNGVPSDATNTDTQVADAVTKAHVRSHVITSTSDHTSTAIPTRVLIADANGLPVSGTNTNTELSSAVTNTHSRSHALDSTSDHSLGSLTTNYLLKNNGSKVVNSLVFDNGNSVGIGTAIPDSSCKLDIQGTHENGFTLRIKNNYNSSAYGLIIETMNTIEQNFGTDYVQMWKNNGVELAIFTADKRMTMLNEGMFDLQSTNITHGCTTVLPTNVHGRISDINHEGSLYSGGIKIIGIGQDTESGDGEGIIIHGISENGIGASFNASIINGTSISSFPTTDIMFGFNNNSTRKVSIFGNGDITLGNTILMAGGSIAGGANSYIKCGYDTSGYGGNKLNIVTPDCSFDTANNWIAPDISLQCGKNTYPNPDLYGNIILNPGGGSVGIGTTAPTNKLVVSESTATNCSQTISARGGNSLRSELFFGTKDSGGNNIGGCLGSNGALGGGLAFKGSTAGITTPDMFISVNSNVGIATDSPSEKLHVVGNIRNSALAGTGNRAVYSDASGNLTNSSSDERLKINIETLEYGIEDVIKLRPVKYNWREDLQSITKEIEVEQIDNETGENVKAKEYITEVRKGSQKEIGLIAQEVQNIIPEVIGTNSDGTLSVDYPKLVSVLIGAIQDLKKEIDTLKKR